MSFSLYANVELPLPKELRSRLMGPPPHYTKAILAGTYATKQLAQWWAINTKRVYVDDEKTIVIPEGRICSFEIIEE